MFQAYYNLPPVDMTLDIFIVSNFVDCSENGAISGENNIHELIGIFAN